jgi:hypothetical protein
MDLAVRMSAGRSSAPPIRRHQDRSIGDRRAKHGGHSGRGEAVPYARYGETPEGVANAIEAMRPRSRTVPDCAVLQTAMPLRVPHALIAPLGL